MFHVKHFIFLLHHIIIATLYLSPLTYRALFVNSGLRGTFGVLLHFLQIAYVHIAFFSFEDLSFNIAIMNPNSRYQQK